MAKFPEAEARRFRNIFVCRVCKRKIRTPNMRVVQGAVACRTCRQNKLRPVRKK